LPLVAIYLLGWHLLGMAGTLDSWLLVEVDSCLHTTAAQCFLHNTHHSHYSDLESAGLVFLPSSTNHMTSAAEVVRVGIGIAVAHWFQSRSLSYYSEAVKPYGLDHLALLMVHEEVHLVGNYRKVDRSTDVPDSGGAPNQKNTVLLAEGETACHRWRIDV